MIPHVWWLLAGVVGLYVYDAAWLLYDNEIVFFEKADGRWSFSAGSDFELGGRHVYVPALFAPQRKTLRLRWSSRHEPAPHRALHGLRAWRIGMARIAPFAGLIGVVFAALLPVLASDSAIWLLAWMALAYGVILIAVVRAWRLRRITGTSDKAFAGIASDAILCAPYALNLIRKHGMHAHLRFDLTAAAHRLLDDAERARLAATIGDRLQRQLALEDDGSERHARIVAYQRHIEGVLA